jgi:hypothetical protein
MDFEDLAQLEETIISEWPRFRSIYIEKEFDDGVVGAFMSGPEEWDQAVPFTVPRKDGELVLDEIEYFLTEVKKKEEEK